MGVFDGFIDLAVELVTENGEISTLVRRVDSAPADPDKPWRPGPDVPEEHEVHAVWIDQMTARKLGMLLTDEQSGVLIPAKELAFAPDPSVDSVRRAAGDLHAVESVNEINPNGQKILYVLKVKS